LDTNKNQKVRKGLLEYLPVFTTTTVQSFIFISGLVINKCIALYSGPTGIALFGIIKNFHVFFGSLIKLGSDTVIINSAAKSQGSNVKISNLLGSIIRLSILQVIFVLFIFSFFDEFLYRKIFSIVIPSELSWLVRLILILVFFTAFSEMMTSFFNGLLDYRKVFISSLSGSLFTMVLALILKPDSLSEVAFLALSSGFFSALILMLFLSQNYLGAMKTSLPVNIFSNLPTSIILLMQPIAVSLSMIIMQQLIGNSFGIEQLSYFIMCWTLLGAGLTLMMSSVRMYFLPRLATLEGHHERNKFFQNNLLFFVCLASIAIIVISFFSDFIIKTLYSNEFLNASKYLVLLSSTLILKAFEWIVAVSSWERERFKFYIIPECSREIFYVLSCLALIYLGVEFLAIIVGLILVDIVISLIWVGYLQYFRDELKLNPLFIISIYLFTILLLAYNLYRL